MYVLVVLYLLSFLTYAGFEDAGSICLQENFVMIWDLKQYSNIDYANIHHGHELIATVAAPSFVVIQKEYQHLVLLNVTESWIIEMTVKNITYKENGVYTCTVGFTSRMKNIKLQKDITVTDLDDAISLYTSVDTGCSVVNCLSKHNVTLLGPGRKKIKNGTCLSEMENGIYSCCLLSQTVCQNEDCKYINVSTEYHTYTNTVGKTESTSPSITKNGEMDNQYTKVTIVIIVLVVVILVVVFLGVIILTRKKICKNSKRGAEKPTEENGHMLSDGTV